MLTKEIDKMCADFRAFLETCVGDGEWAAEWGRGKMEIETETAYREFKPCDPMYFFLIRASSARSASESLKNAAKAIHA